MKDILILGFKQRVSKNPEGRTVQGMYRAWFTVSGRMVIDYD